MDVARIASVISEQIDDKPQELLNGYVKSVATITFADFSSYCSARCVHITEDTFVEMLANNGNYLFTESEEGWVSTPVGELESELGF